MPDAALTDLTVVQLAEAIARGELTPLQVAEAYLARIDALEPHVQAFSYLDRERVLTDAATLDREAKAGTLRGPLHGVPVAVKDEFHVAGMPTFCAEPDTDVRSEDSTAVARLRAAGALILGKTHMPIGSRLPPTRNPWNLEHTAGGTSSGSGAAVGARMAPLALGEQTAGSCLRPAAYCGVAAIKPTYGRIGRYGMYPFAWSHDHAGLIGLTASDLALGLSVLSGFDSRDPTSLHESATPADLQADTLRPPRIGIVRNFFPERTEPVMLDAIQRSAETMRAAGATVEDVRLPDEFGMLWQLHTVVGGAEGLTFRASRLAGKPLNARDLAASLLPATYYLQAQRIRGHLRNTMRVAFAGYDALVMAVAPGPAPRGIHTTGDAVLLRPWSCIGYPTITVNGGRSPDGLPLGLQLVSTPLDDYALLRTGAWCESVLGVLPSPPMTFN